VASRRAYPNLADGSLNCTCANSSFNSLQITYINRLAAGLDFQGAYTFAHSLDNSSGNSNAVGIQNPFDLRSYRGNSDFDIRHNLVLSWSYALPFGRGKKFAADARGVLQAIIGGWRLNSIDSFISGPPFTPVMVSSLLNSGSAGQWPNRIGSGHLEHRTISAWFNPADFVSPGNYTYGNSGRNILFGPGTKQIDLSLFKDFAFNQSGSRRLQFRAEAFNFLNTPQFNAPSRTFGSADFGRISSTVINNREMQFGLKYKF
jgi:hypothetical protein